MSTPVFSNVTTPSQVMQLMADGGMTAQQGNSILYNMYNTGLFQNGGSAFVQSNSPAPSNLTPGQNMKVVTDPANSPQYVTSSNPSATMSNSTAATNAQANSNTNAVTSFISSHAGNWGIIILGAGLIFAALIISNKETVIKLGEVAAL